MSVLVQYNYHLFSYYFAVCVPIPTKFGTRALQPNVSRNQKPESTQINSIKGKNQILCNIRIKYIIRKFNDFWNFWSNRHKFYKYHPLHGAVNMVIQKNV